MSDSKKEAYEKYSHEFNALAAEMKEKGIDPKKLMVVVSAFKEIYK